MLRDNHSGSNKLIPYPYPTSVQECLNYCYYYYKPLRYQFACILTTTFRVNKFNPISLLKWILPLKFRACLMTILLLLLSQRLKFHSSNCYKYSPLRGQINSINFFYQSEDVEAFKVSSLFVFNDMLWINWQGESFADSLVLYTNGAESRTD